MSCTYTFSKGLKKGTVCGKKTCSIHKTTVPDKAPENQVVPTPIMDPWSSVPVQRRCIDLFCGIGGFHQAMRRIGYTCVFACDIDEQCRKVYEDNYGLLPASDIKKVDETTLPDFDLLCAGFPCQSFSNAGKKKSMEDQRGTLFEDILRIASYKRPSFMFLENVKHIKKIDDGAAFAHICNRIREVGYVIHPETMLFELSPHQFGVPQLRERVVFVCVRADIYDPVKTFLATPPLVPTNWSIMESNVDPKYRISDELIQLFAAWDEMIQVVEPGQSLSPTILCNEFKKVYTPAEWAVVPKWKQDYVERNKPIYEKYQTQWDDWYAKHQDLLTKKEIYGKLEWQAGKKKAGDSIWNYFIQMRQSGIRVKKTDYFPTLVAIVQTPIYTREKRYITPRECARLQSFPDDFRIHPTDHIAYKQCGNSVNVDVIHFVLQRVLTAYHRL